MIPGNEPQLACGRQHDETVRKAAGRPLGNAPPQQGGAETPRAYAREIQIGDAQAVWPSAWTSFTNQLVSSAPGHTAKLSSTS